MTMPCSGIPLENLMRHCVVCSVFVISYDVFKNVEGELLMYCFFEFTEVSTCNIMFHGGKKNQKQTCSHL